MLSYTIAWAEANSHNDGRLLHFSSIFVHNDVFKWMNYCRNLKYFKVYINILGCKYLPYFIKLNFQTKHKILLYQIMNKQNKKKWNQFKQQLHCLLNTFVCSISARRITFVVQWPKNGQYDSLFKCSSNSRNFHFAMISLSIYGWACLVRLHHGRKGT